MKRSASVLRKERAFILIEKRKETSEKKKKKVGFKRNPHKYILKTFNLNWWSCRERSKKIRGMVKEDFTFFFVNSFSTFKKSQSLRLTHFRIVKVER